MEPEATNSPLQNSSKYPPVQHHAYCVHEPPSWMRGPRMVDCCKAVMSTSGTAYHLQSYQDGAPTNHQSLPSAKAPTANPKHPYSPRPNKRMNTTFVHPSLTAKQLNPNQPFSRIEPIRLCTTQSTAIQITSLPGDVCQTKVYAPQECNFLTARPNPTTHH